jgi:YfiH family protein
VLFRDSRAGVVAAAHAGWRGALDGILDATLDEMEAAGARREDVHAVIGPSISQRAYEVGPEFLERFMDDDPRARGSSSTVRTASTCSIFRATGSSGCAHAGVGAAEWTRHCTYSDSRRFYSYRRSVHRKEADYGRLISAIRL